MKNELSNPPIPKCLDEARTANTIAVNTADTRISNICLWCSLNFFTTGDTFKRTLIVAYTKENKQEENCLKKK